MNQIKELEAKIAQEDYLNDATLNDYRAEHIKIKKENQRLKADNSQLDLEKRNILSELHRTIASNIFIGKTLELEVENKRLREASEDVRRTQNWLYSNLCDLQAWRENHVVTDVIFKKALEK